MEEVLCAVCRRAGVVFITSGRGPSVTDGLPAGLVVTTVARIISDSVNYEVCYGMFANTRTGRSSSYRQESDVRCCGGSGRLLLANHGDGACVRRRGENRRGFLATGQNQIRGALHGSGRVRRRFVDGRHLLWLLHDCRGRRYCHPRTAQGGCSGGVDSRRSNGDGRRARCPAIHGDPEILGKH